MAHPCSETDGTADTQSLIARPHATFARVYLPQCPLLGLPPYRRNNASVVIIWYCLPLPGQFLANRSEPDLLEQLEYQEEEILLATVEGERGFTKLQVHEFLRHPAAAPEPVARLPPGALDAIEVMASLILADDHVVAPHGHGGVGVQVVHAGRGARLDLLADRPSDGGGAGARRR